MDGLHAASSRPWDEADEERLTEPPSCGRECGYPRFLDMLAAEDRRVLLAGSVVKRLGRGQVLYVQDDASRDVFVILQGAVKIHYIHGAGASLTTSYYRDGMLVGAHGCSDWAGHHRWSAQAVVETRVLWIARDQLLALTSRSPNALRCVLAVTEFKAEQLKSVIHILAETTVERRAAMALRHLGRLYGIACGGEVEIDGRFTHQEIAEMIGASRQSVTTALLGMERLGEIRRDRRRLFIRAAADRRAPRLRGMAERGLSLPAG